MPVTLGLAAEEGFLSPGQNVALLGIGSGINCLMLGANWQHTKVQGQIWMGESETSALRGPNWKTQARSLEAEK